MNRTFHINEKPVLTFIFSSNAFCQSWMPGVVELADGQKFTGEFTLEAFGNSEVVRHKKKEGQNTYLSENIKRLSLWDKENNDSIYFKQYVIDDLEFKSPPSVLFEVLYESDSIRLLKKNFKSVKWELIGLPLPGMLVLGWISSVQAQDVILMTDSDLRNMDVINKPFKEYPRPKVANIEVNRILKTFMSDHRAEILKFVKQKKLKWNRLDDLSQITAYYDSLL